MKYIFLDIDGVVYNQGRINEAVINLINITNNKYIFCTGRGYLRCLDIINDFITDESHIIIENGSKIINGRNKKSYSRRISEDTKQIITKIDPQYIDFIVFNPNDSDYYFSYGKEKKTHVEKNFDTYNEFVDFLLKKDMTQITIKFTDEYVKKKFAKLCQDNDINYHYSENYIIINSVGTNKKSAIEYYIKSNKLKLEDCIVVGNDYNDLEMFDIECYQKIAIVDEFTPNELKKKATIVTDFDNLYNELKNII